MRRAGQNPTEAEVIFFWTQPIIYRVERITLKLANFNNLVAGAGHDQ